MICIRQRPDEVPSDWLSRAEALTQRLKAMQSEEERKKLIDDNDGLWGELKGILLAWSGGKCWYSEAKDLVADWHVDHFRPKKRAIALDDSARTGYWWLAFDWRNYRLAGSICNCAHKGEKGTQGKRDYFPLQHGCVPAVREEQLPGEMCYLLDPTNERDVALLDFDETGIPKSAMPAGTWAAERVRVTVSLLHLDYEPLVEARRAVWLKVVRKMDQIEAALSLPVTGATAYSEASAESLIRELIEMIASGAQLSGTARVCIAKSRRSWALRLLDRTEPADGSGG